MANIEIYTDADCCWPDLAGRAEDVLGMTAGPSDPPWRLALRPGGLRRGGASVVLRIDLPDGRILLSEVGLKSLVEVVELLEIADHRHTHPRRAAEAEAALAIAEAGPDPDPGPPAPPPAPAPSPSPSDMAATLAKTWAAPGPKDEDR